MANHCYNSINIVLAEKYENEIFSNKFFNLDFLYNWEENYDRCNYPHRDNFHLYDKLELSGYWEEKVCKYFTEFSTNWDYPKELYDALSRHPGVYIIEGYFQEPGNWILWGAYYNSNDDEWLNEKWDSISFYHEDYPEYAYSSLTWYSVYKELPDNDSYYWDINDRADNVSVETYLEYFKNKENLNTITLDKSEVIAKVTEDIQETLIMLDFEDAEIEEIINQTKNELFDILWINN